VVAAFDEEDRNRIGHEVLKNLGNEPEQRANRSRVVADFFSGLVLPEKPAPFTEKERGRLVTLADLGARCRSPVVRDRYKGDNLELVPEAESPGRLAGALSQLAAGMRAVGTPSDERWRLVREVALGGSIRSGPASSSTSSGRLKATPLRPSPPGLASRRRRYAAMSTISSHWVS